jgi:hypothetical protein
MESISEGVSACLDGFKKLSVLDTECSSLQKIRDEYHRFKVWEGNIGAHRRGRRSMEYRLRDASHIRRQVMNLLEDLEESLSSGRFFLLY